MKLVKGSVKVTGLKELRAAAKEDTLIGGPFMTAMQGVRDDAVAATTAGAPVGSTGNLSRNFKGTVSAGPVPRYVTIRSTATNQGYPYGRRLEYDTRLGHVNWFLGSIKGMWGKVEGRLRAAAHEMEEIWGKK